MRIGFYDHGLSHRGTTRAIIAYIKALYSLDSVSLFHFYDIGSEHNSRSMITSVIKSGEAALIPIGRSEDSGKIILKYSLDWVYYVTSEDPAKLPKWCYQICSQTTVLVHQVGYQAPLVESEGLVHAYTSHWQNSFLGEGKSKVLPYMIPNVYYDARKKSSLRATLGISHSATVLGRHGGADTFNLAFAIEAITRVVSERNDLHIIFAGTKKQISHPRVHYLPSIVQEDEIINFIDSCDAMLHCRWEGETYGLACAEFLARGRPIITWSHSRERNHILIADRACLFFNDQSSLEELLRGISNDTLASLAKLIDMRHLEYYRPDNILLTLKDILKLQ